MILSNFSETGKRVLLAVAVAMAAASGAWALSRVPASQYLDLQLRKPQQVRPTLKTSLVSIQYGTLEREPSVGSTVSRKRIGDLIRFLAEVGARVIVLDLMFTEPSAEDIELRRAITDVAPVPVILNAQSTEAVETPPGELPAFRFRYPTCLPLITPDHVQVASPVAWEPDATVRGAPLLVRDADVDEQMLPNTGLAAWLALEGEPLDRLRWDKEVGGWRASRRVWQVDAYGNFETAWLKPSALPEFEFSSVLEKQADSEAFRDAVVILFSRTDSARDNDLHPTPIGTLSGAEILASIMQSLESPRPAERPMLWGLLLTMMGASSVSFCSLRPRAGTLILSLLLGGLTVWIGWHLGTSFSWVAGSMLFALALSLGGHGLSTTRILSRAFSRLASKPHLVKKDIAATVMFVDLADSTDIIQGRSNQEAADLLSGVLRVIIGAAKQQGVSVENTLGDGALLVLYGDEHPKHAEVALEAMKGIRRAILAVGDEFDEKYGIRPRLTFGVASGEIAGRLLKTKDHFGASLHGSIVHLAARLQSRCSDKGVEAIGSPDFAACHTRIARSLGYETLKGLGEVELFALDLS